ncbi:hypothetical protein GLOIN_2v1140040 [Rhizophagus clarus]|uniref:Uncharacterized protein n=1 Tax=Rhizophagus clarus TaxID=94130 RepID=A0A8H3M7T0_9GLOM|nr:hypothetical protein GLOIN_2v1140040 [Rhizophagus clarus]
MELKDLGFIFYRKYPNASKRESHNDLSGELKILSNNLKPKSKEGIKIFALEHQLKGLTKETENLPPSKRNNNNESENEEKKFKYDFGKEKEQYYTRHGSNYYESSKSEDDENGCNIKLNFNELQHRFYEYQFKVLKKAETEKLKDISLSSIIVLRPLSPYPIFTNKEWEEIIGTNPYTIQEPLFAQEISSSIRAASFNYFLSKDVFMKSGKSKLSRTVARIKMGE